MPSLNKDDGHVNQLSTVAGIYINLTTRSFIYQSPSSNCCLWMSNLTARDQCWVPTWHLSSGISNCNQMASWLQQVAFLERIRDFFFPTRINIYFRCWLVFPEHRASVSTIIWMLTECLVHEQGIPHNILSDQEVLQWTHDHQIYWPYHKTHHPKAGRSHWALE